MRRWPHGPSTQQEVGMNAPKSQFRIQLTEEQKNQVRNATGKSAEAIELSVEELEERIAPGKVIPGQP
jgi:hypothetical protein